MNKLNSKRLSKKFSLSVQNQIVVPKNIKNKFLNESNTIVNEIIEKIISLVISSNFNNNVEKKISFSCYRFIKGTINSYLSSSFIAHDRDETFQNSYLNSKSELIIPEIEPISVKNDYSNIDGYNLNNNSQTFSNLKLDDFFYFNNYYHGENDWDLMEEPTSNKYDRYATTLIKFKEVEKQNNFKYNKNGEVLEEVDEESEKNFVNDNINDRKDSNQSKLKESKKQIKFYKVNNNKNAKKNLIDMMNQFSYHDLDDNNDLYNEPKDINYAQLRKEVQEKQNVENEEKKIINKAKIEIENKIKAEAEKNRQYIGKKITVDPKGEIVFIKGIKLDKLNKEFNLLRTNTKLVVDEEKEKEKRRNRKKRINKEEIIKDEKGNIINKEEVEKNKNNEDKNQKLKATKLLPKIKNNKFRYSVKELIEENSKSRLLKRIEEGPIVLSGSNFEIMNMEVGVSLKENEKYKTGGKDFYHKYNKYSVANYNKQLKETTEMNSFLKTHVENTENPTKSDFNYLGNLTDTYNSSVGFINNSNINQQIQNSKNLQITNYNTLSNFGNSSIKRKELSSSLSPQLKLSFGVGTLLGSMEKLNLITERQERFKKKTDNIFKNNISNYASTKEIFLPKLEEINKFTSEILTSSNWMKKSGINNSIGSPFRSPGKPGYKEIRREMGIRGKILRNRMKKNIQNQEENSALETLDFFKRKV